MKKIKLQSRTSAGWVWGGRSEGSGGLKQAVREGPAEKETLEPRLGAGKGVGHEGARGWAEALRPACVGHI